MESARCDRWVPVTNFLLSDARIFMIFTRLFHGDVACQSIRRSGSKSRDVRVASTKFITREGDSRARENSRSFRVTSGGGRGGRMGGGEEEREGRGRRLGREVTRV